MTDIRVLIADVLTDGPALAWRDSHTRLERRVHRIADQLGRGDESEAAADQALAYLEADPYYFWSGYARARLARSLAHAPTRSRPT